MIYYCLTMFVCRKLRDKKALFEEDFEEIQVCLMFSLHFDFSCKKK